MRGAAVAGIAALAVASADAQVDWAAPAIVTRVCSGCHGIDGNAQLPTTPRLAGQNATYLAQQLAAFQRAPLPDSIEIPARLVPAAKLPSGARVGAEARIAMIGPAHRLQGDEGQEASAWYAKQKPAPGTAADATLVVKGRDLFEKGVPRAGVIACMDCHGAGGVGLATFPRLAGQHAGYIERQLYAFSTGERPPGGAMHNEAKGLTAEDAAAVAAYLQSQ
ncbi:MAG: c-type cytochrome [Burkholderiales bacterium]